MELAFSSSIPSVQSSLLLLMLVIFCFYVYKKSTKRRNLPPGPKGWPLVGNLMSLNFHWERTLSEWSMEYGPVFFLRMANIKLVVLGSVEAVQEAFVKKADAFSDRYVGAVPGFTRGTGILPMSYGHNLREQRKFGLATLREFGMGKRSIEPAILEKCSELHEKIEQKCDSEEPFSIEYMVYETVSSVISQLVFNKDIAAERKDFKEFLNLVITGTEHSVLNGITAFCPPLKSIPPFSYGYKESVQHEEHNYQMIQEEVDEHKKDRDSDHPRDLIDCFLNEMEVAGKGGGRDVETSFNEEQLGSVVRDLFLAGSETTSTTFCWIVLYLTRQPEIQEKLHEEILRILGHDSQPSMWKSDEMPYTRAVIQEALRIRPVAPLGLPHRAAEDATIMGYDIPKGTLVMSNIFGIHHDRSVWKNPDRFDPERHLDDEGKFFKSPHLIPFSIGARQCLGIQLANMELFVLVVSVFQRYSLRLLSAEEIDIRGKNMFTLRPFSFKVVASRR